MQIGNVETPRARKIHTCWWCGEDIVPGFSYVRWTWKDGMDLAVVKVHPECRQAWLTLDQYEGEEVGFAEFARGCTCENGACRCDSGWE